METVLIVEDRECMDINIMDKEINTARYFKVK